MAVKIVKKIVITLGIIAGLVVLLAVAGGIYLESKAGDIIRDEFNRATGGKYTLEMKRVSVSLFSASLRLDDVKVRQDSVNGNHNGGLYVALDAKSLGVSGIRFKRRDGKLNISFSEVRISEPDVIVTAPTEPDANGGSSAGGGQGFDVALERLDVRRVIVEGGKAEYSKVAGRDTTSTTLEAVNIEARGFSYPGGVDSSKVLWADDMLLTVGRLVNYSSSKLVTIELDSIYASTSDDIAGFAAFRKQPVYGKGEYAWHNRRHADWTQITTAGVSCKGVDFGRIQSEHVLAADSIHVDGLAIASYKNRKIKRTEWVKPMFSRRLKDLPVRIDFREVSIGNGYGRYEELSEDGENAGIVTFGNIRAHATGVTNIAVSRDQFVTMNARAEVMGRGALNATFHIPVHPQNDFFEVSASLGSMEMSAFNSMALNTAGIEVKSGRLKQMKFYISGTPAKAHIDMTMKYDDLEMIVMKGKTEYAKKRKFLSSVANIVLKKQNPDRHGLREVRVEAERDPYRSPFNYMWKTIFAGVKKSFGMPEL